MKKLFSFCLAIFSVYQANSQRAEALDLLQVPPPSNFINDPDSQAALLSRLRYIAQWQSGNIGRFDTADRWIGIGQPRNPASPGNYFPVYGFRTQWGLNAINYAIRQPNPGIPVALLEFGTDETNTSPTAPKISELKIRYFTNPAIPTSAFDFMVFNGKTRNIIAGQNTVNAYGSEPKFAVYDGFNPTPGIFPAPFSTGAVYGVSDGLDGSGSPVANAVGVAGDVLNSTASSGSFAVLGIASTTKGNHWAGYFSGRVFSTGGYLGSDRKLKRDVKTEEGALKKLMQLKPSSYYYNTGSYKTMGLETNLQHGFIAQELEEIFPEMIAEVRAPGNANNTFKAINYSGLHAIQVAAIQELKAEIDELKAQLAAARTYVVEKTSLSEDEKSLLENKAWSLSQNTPNPFSNATTIRYTIPAAAGKATIAVFDLSGKMLLQFDGLADSGQLTIQGNKLQPGMYLYSILHKGEEIFTRKMVLTR